MPISQFEAFNDKFARDRMQELTASPQGLLWLKVRSIMRKPILNALEAHMNIRLRGNRVADRAAHLYEQLLQNPDAGHLSLNAFIRGQGQAYDPQHLQHIASELHKMRHFSWGGDYSNALDRFLVDRYIKRLDTYDDICSKLATDIPAAVTGYVLCSWYNHWSAILIESIFRQHM